MTVSRNRALALVALLATADPVSASLAQVPDPTAGELAPVAPPAVRSDPTAPVQLGPRRAIAPVVAPTPASAPAGTPLSGSPPGGGPVIKLQTLETVDTDSVGTLDDAQGGLGVDMWRGTPRAQVGQLLALLPRRVGSPAMRNLMRRLLLTRAAVPVSEKPVAGLFGRRVAALAGVGDRAALRALVELAPSGSADENQLRIRAESWFYGNETGKACRIVRGEAREQKSAYWLQATAFCLALGGKKAEASLVSDILDERGEKVPSVFFAAMEAISGAAPPPLEDQAVQTGLHLAMLRAAKLPVPAGTLRDATPAALAAIAANPKTPVDERLAAAEEAARLGALSGRALFEIYGDAGGPAEDLERVLERAAAEWSPRSRAFLVRTAARYDVPAARAEVLQQAFRLGREKGGFQVVALAARPLLQDMKPADELRWFAPLAARALLLTDQVDAAAGWIALGLDAGRTGAAGENLWPLSALMRGPGDAVTPEAVAEWWSRQDRTAAGTTQRAQVLFALLEAQGVALSGPLWADIIDDPRSNGLAAPSLALRHALARAAADNRRGETAALVLVALGEAGPEPANLGAVELAIDALRRVGLVDDARRLAFETAIAAGL